VPRTLVRAPGHDRSRSLGWLALAWMEYFVVHGPGDVQGDPVQHGDEYAGFIVDCYALGDSPVNRHMLYDSGFLSRPKGCDKSGLGARFGLFEAFGPCRWNGRYAQGGEVYRDPWGLGFQYVYQPGEPMGRPVDVPYIRIMATEEGQTGNVYDTIYYNLTDAAAPLSAVPDVDAGLTRIMLPDGGEITPSTAGSSSKDGGKETWVCFDESHLYNMPELRRMYTTVTRNLRKRKQIAGTWYLETTTMFAPGENSIAEATYELAEAIAEGRSRRSRLLYDHRWGECEDLADEPALRAAIQDAYGDATGWIDVESIINDFYDPRNDPVDSRRYFLNVKTSSFDSWLAQHEWVACKDEDLSLAEGDLITLGFDGSKNDDSTALVACRVADGFLQILGVWEKPVGPAGDGWKVDGLAVDAAVAAAMARYEVCGMYADPPHWQDYVDRWSAEFADRLQVKATGPRPLEWWTNRPRFMVAALERFREAVVDKGLRHSGERVLTRHALNARRRISRSGVTIAKEHPGSPRKIDAVMAAVLAYECRADAVALGVTTQNAPMGGYSF
jgi:hypothetical protein